MSSKAKKILVVIVISALTIKASFYLGSLFANSKFTKQNEKASEYMEVTKESIQEVQESLPESESATELDTYIEEEYEETESIDVSESSKQDDKDFLYVKGLPDGDLFDEMGDNEVTRFINMKIIEPYDDYISAPSCISFEKSNEVYTMKIVDGVSDEIWVYTLDGNFTVINKEQSSN